MDKMTEHKHRFQVLPESYRMWVNEKDELIRDPKPYNSKNKSVRMYSFICECGQGLEVRQKSETFIGVKV